jgi:hypothetical protein
MSCGTNTVTQQSAPPSQYLSAYSNVLGQAQQTAAQPLQQYSGNIVQGFSPDQTTAFNTVAGASQPITQAGNTVAGAAGAANPYLAQAQTNLTAATAPLWSGVQQFSPGAVSQYESPYTSDVVNATQAEFNNQNAQQQNALGGASAAAGAFGGDRQAVAQAQLAGQEQLAQAPTIANLENQGYSTALGEFNTQQQSQLQANEANSWLNSQAGFGEMNLGQEAQNLPLTEAQAQLGIGSAQLGQASAQLQTGGLEQQLGQEQLNVPYEEFLQQQAYPFQTTNYLAGIAEGTGSAAGGTSTSSSPGPSIASELTGLGTTGLALNNLGAFGSGGIGALLGGSTIDTAAVDASLAGEGDALYAGAGALLAAHGGAIRPHANGGNVIPFRRRGGMVPIQRDAGGMLPYQQIPVTPNIPNVSVQFVPQTSGQSRGMGIPRAPAAYQQQDPFNSQQLMQVGNLLKNSPAGGGGGSMQRGGKVRRYADGGTTDDGDDIPVPIPRPAQPNDPVAPQTGMTPQNFGFTAPTPITLNPQKADPNMALLTAGLGMLGGTSPHPLENIGRGAMAGLQEFQQNKQQNESLAEKQANVEGTNQRNTLSYQEAQSRAKELADNLEQTRDNMARLQSNADRQFTQEQHNQDLQRKFQADELALHNKELNFNEGLSGGAAPVTGPGGQKVTGDAYLQTLPASDQAVVKAMVEGRQPPPTSFAMSKPYWQQRIQEANNYDPSFDQTTWPGRVKTRTSFAGGPDAANVTAIDTALQHAGVVSQALGALGNTSVPMYNTAKNWLAQEFGSSAPTNARESVDALSSEARKVFQATGGGNLTELENWQKNFPVNGSPEQQKGSLSQFVSLLDSRLDALADKYNRGMGKAEDKLTFLSPRARDVYQSLTGRSPQTDSATNPAAHPAPAATIPAGAISYLKAHPETRSHFDSMFGPGASNAFMGQQ